jgi:hypothetical protein
MRIRGAMIRGRVNVTPVSSITLPFTTIDKHLKKVLCDMLDGLGFQGVHCHIKYTPVINPYFVLLFLWVFVFSSFSFILVLVVYPGGRRNIISTYQMN